VPFNWNGLGPGVGTGCAAAHASELGQPSKIEVTILRQLPQAASEPLSPMRCLGLWN